MARKQPDTDTSFIVEYEDDTTTTITIDRWTLRSGDRVARIVAGEWQQGGRIREGKMRVR